MAEQDKPQSEFEERLVELNRVSRTVKGGKRMRFRALVVVGNRNGRVGMGMGKAGDVQQAIKKAGQAAKKKMINRGSFTRVTNVADTPPFTTFTSFVTREIRFPVRSLLK